MNATSLYVSATQLACRLGFDTKFDEIVQGLNELMPKLRQLLGCSVCRSLVTDPYVVRNRQCDHSVCRECINGRKVLQPPCENCNDSRDFKSYDENSQLNHLLQCYRSLCEYIANSSIYSLLSTHPIKNEIDSIPTLILWNMSTHAIVAEGAQLDNFSAFSTDISLNLDVEALEAASVSATNRLKQYRRDTNPDANVSDDEEISNNVQQPFANYNGYHTESSLENHVENHIDNNHLTNGYGPQPVSNEIINEQSRNGPTTDNDAAMNEPLLNGETVHRHDNMNGETTNHHNNIHDDQMLNDYTTNNDFDMNDRLNHAPEMVNQDPNIGENYYLNGGFEEGGMHNGYHDPDDTEDIEIDQENTAPNSENFTTYYEQMNGFDIPENTTEVRHEESISTSN